MGKGAAFRMQDAGGDAGPVFSSIFHHPKSALVRA